MAKMLLALVLVSLAIISHTPVAVALQPNATQEFLDAHNQARAEVGVEPLKWSDMLAKATSLLVRYQRDKMGCNLADLSTDKKNGGNQMRTSWLGLTPRSAVNAWVAQKKHYNYANNSCAAAEQSKCWVYTQVVWRKSVELGCSQARCVKEDAALTICFYNPHGNVVGERPY